MDVKYLPNIGVGVVLTDSAGLTTYINEFFTKLTGYTMSDMIGNKPGHILQGADTDQNTVSTIRDDIRDNHNIDKVILNYTKNKHKIWLRLIIDPIYVDGKLEGYSSFQIDVSQSYRTNENHNNLIQYLTEESEIKNKLVSAISHDLRNPLLTIGNIYNLIKDNGDLFTELAPHIQDNATLCLKIISQLKTIYTHPMLNSDIIFVKKETNTVISDYCFAVCEKQINIVNNIDNAFTMNINAEYFSVILRNIIGNAIKYSHRGGDIIIYNNKDQLIIQDFGMGINDEILNKINKNESIVSAPGTSGEKGTGHGLLLCNYLLKRQCHYMDIQSKPGEGTSIRIKEIVTK